MPKDDSAKVAEAMANRAAEEGRMEAARKLAEAAAKAEADAERR